MLLAMTEIFGSKTDFLVRSIAEWFALGTAAAAQLGVGSVTLLRTAGTSQCEESLQDIRPVHSRRY